MFLVLSCFRLCIRNLPPSLDDRGLRSLLAKHIPKEAKILEAKVMRDMANKQAGVAASKEYSFVSLAQHEHALLLLRNLNNNPNIFGADRRPIVDFSIENRKALLARQMREEKSRTNNPNFKGDKTSNILARYKNTDTKAAGRTADAKRDFSGAIADPKVKTLPKHTGEKIRHKDRASKISRKDLRKAEQDRKNPKKRKLRQESEAVIKEPPQKKQKVKRLNNEDKKDLKEHKAFDELVNKYRSRFASNQTVVKKWFDT